MISSGWNKDTGYHKVRPIKDYDESIRCLSGKKKRELD
jgi:hypothetical protein